MKEHLKRGIAVHHSGILPIVKEVCNLCAYMCICMNSLILLERPTNTCFVGCCVESSVLCIHNGDIMCGGSQCWFGCCLLMHVYYMREGICGDSTVKIYVYMYTYSDTRTVALDPLGGSEYCVLSTYGYKLRIECT